MVSWQQLDGARGETSAVFTESGSSESSPAPRQSQDAAVIIRSLLFNLSKASLNAGSCCCAGVPKTVMVWPSDDISMS